MRIAEFIVHHVRIPLKKEIKHASHARTATDSLIVQCRLDSGAVGWGEGLPRSYVTGETLEQAWDLLPEIAWRTAFGASLSTLVDAVALLDAFTMPRPADDDRQCFGNSLRCAIELSVLDAVCRELRVPLSAVTAVVPETASFRQDVPHVHYSGAFTGMTALKQRVRAALFRLFGFRQAKIKVGMAGVDDTALLRRIRGIVGSRMDLRIDANEAWTCETLVKALAPLRPFQISSVEQPVPHAQVAGLGAIRPQLGIPVMLDESLCSSVDARRAIDEGTCDLFNLRLSKCGGYIPALRLAAMARQHGLGYQLGCQVGETGVLSAAGRHFATSVAGIRFLEGSYDGFLVKERLTRENLTFGYGGRAPALTAPGLSVSVSPEALERVAIQRCRFSVS